MEFSSQVNRELMGVIESLQQRIVDTKHSEDSSEESDDTLDMVADACEVSSQILEEAKDLILKHQKEAKPQQTDEQNETGDNDMSNIGGQEEARIFPGQQDNVNDETGVDTDQSEMGDTEERPTRELEQIANDEGSQSVEDAGVQGRNKRAKMVVAH